MSTLFLWNSLFSTESFLRCISVKIHIYKVLMGLTEAFLMMV